MPKNLILRLSNEMGNQMFMYASAYSISKKLNRELLIDEETAFLLKKNVSSFGLGFFNITANYAPDNLKYKNLHGYIKRKFFIKTDFLRVKKKFYIEKKDNRKITEHSNRYKNINFDNNLFVEGHFETERYFQDYKEEIKKEFKIKNEENLKNNPYFNELNKPNSVAICLRQNRFTEGKGQNTPLNKHKSANFSDEQINYINKSVNFIKSKVAGANFFLWSNDFSSIDNSKFNFNYKEVKLDTINNQLDKRILSLFLLKQCNHFVVTNSTFNWWGAWLSNKNNKLILRPSSNFFKDFYLNNQDFWPEHWNVINV
tara:strand:- start:1615 stop:2556 length:942 start_codon:yes stop_codon:yes gene_type:complete